ncbi:hypothetical protein PIB30_072140 [Stylosanthes scabra]|uniref:DUF4283 domain-containing protein n=1 Tax=Stylosanthes scabra TaxID=79078 RepID=A0ABU6YLK5_9FABA|nr:hypothetical protein [Stylosanthes scabra]
MGKPNLARRGCQGNGHAVVDRNRARYEKGKRNNNKQWVPTGRRIDWPGGGSGDAGVVKKKALEAREGNPSKALRKELKLNLLQTQCDLLKQSLLGVNVKQFKFADVENTLLKNWEGPGIIECRDVALFRCLITFESEKIMEEALGKQSFLSAFDKVRHHWGAVWSLSKRVWVEVMGLPTFVWSEETFNSIAKLWEISVYADDRIEEFMSFSMAMFLIVTPQYQLAMPRTCLTSIEIYTLSSPYNHSGRLELAEMLDSKNPEEHFADFPNLNLITRGNPTRHSGFTFLTHVAYSSQNPIPVV